MNQKTQKAIENAIVDLCNWIKETTYWSTDTRLKFLPGVIQGTAKLVKVLQSNELINQTDQLIANLKKKEG